MTAELDVLADAARTRILRIEQYDEQVERLLAAGGFDAVELRPGCPDFRGLVPHAPAIRWLRGCEPAGLDGLERLTEVRRITFTGSQAAWNFDYRRLPRLRAIEADEAGGLKPETLGHPQLQRVDLVGGTVKDLTPFAGAAALAALRLLACKTRSTQGVQRLPALRELRVLEARALADLAGLEGCGGLEVLELSEAAKLTDLRPVTALHRLRWLFVEAKAALWPDLDWVAQMPGLECLALWSPVQRLDLGVIASHPRLYDVLVQVPAGVELPGDDALRDAFAQAPRVLKHIHRYPKAKAPTLRLELGPPADLARALPTASLQRRLAWPHVGLLDV